MSIKINNTFVVKLNREEYNLIIFMREKLIYGKCQLVVHQGRPIRVEDIKMTEIFNKKPVENPAGESATENGG